MQIYMKHIGSTAADLLIDYDINEAEQYVTLKTNAFDSKLMENFFLSVLKQRHGINAVCDDRTDWNPPRPTYRVFLLLNDVRYEVEAHHLVDVGGREFAMVLRPWTC